MIMLMGVVGFYAKDETIDVQYQKDGKTELAVRPENRVVT